MKKEAKELFKRAVIKTLASQPKNYFGLEGFEIWPDAGIRKGAVLIEKQFDFDADCYQRVVAAYAGMTRTIAAVESELKTFAATGALAFKVPIKFK